MYFLLRSNINVDHEKVVTPVQTNTKFGFAWQPYGQYTLPRRNNTCALSGNARTRASVLTRSTGPFPAALSAPRKLTSINYRLWRDGATQKSYSIYLSLIWQRLKRWTENTEQSHSSLLKKREAYMKSYLGRKLNSKIFANIYSPDAYNILL